MTKVIRNQEKLDKNFTDINTKEDAQHQTQDEWSPKVPVPSTHISLAASVVTPTGGDRPEDLSSGAFPYRIQHLD